MSHIIFCQTRWRKPVPKRISCILNFREKLMPNFHVKIRLLFFKDGYRVTVKISLCICVVLSRDELKVRQNLPDNDYKIYMVCLLVATVNWHKSLQFVKKSNTALLPCLFMILLAVSIIILPLSITFRQEPSVHFIGLPKT